MNNIKNYKLYEEIGLSDIDYEFDLSKLNDIFFPPGLSKNEEEKRKKIDEIKKIAKQGKLYQQLASGKKLTFGVLKALHHDAIEFKVKREYRTGVYKFLYRAVPIGLAYIFFPAWLLSQILGASRALNKIIVPILKINKINYHGFLRGIITKTMDVVEGEFEHFKDDWFYRSFAVEVGLIRMTRKEHIIEFAYYLAEKMEKEDDNKIIPPYYVDNEFRYFLNKKFNLRPPLSKRYRLK